jgi:hypothetical protein
MIKRVLPLLLIVMAIPAFAADTPMHITAAEWAQPRSGEVLLRHPALTQAVQGLQANAGAMLEIRYPGGDSGTLWARELQAWLVALGVESARIRLVPGSETADQVQLRIR